MAINLRLLEALHLQILVHIHPDHRLSRGVAKTGAGGRRISPTTIARGLLAQHQLLRHRSMILARVPLHKREPTRAQSPPMKRTITSADSVAQATSMTIFKAATQIPSRIPMMGILHQTKTWRHANATNRMTRRLLATRSLLELLLLLLLLLLLPLTTQAPDQWLQSQVPAPTTT